MAFIRALSGNGGSSGGSIKTISVTFNTVRRTNVTVPTSGLSKIISVTAYLTNTDSCYGGGIDNNGTWERIGQGGTATGVVSVESDGTAFYWYDQDSRSNVQAYVQGFE